TSAGRVSSGPPICAVPISIRVPVEPFGSDVHVHVLRLEVLEKRLEPEVVAGTALLVPAEGRLARIGAEMVDPDRPCLERMSDPVCAARVAGPDSRRETVADVIGQADRLLVAVERDDDDDR